MKKCFPTNRNIIFELNSQKITKRQKEIIHSFYKQQREAYVIKQKDKESKKEIIKIENADTIILPPDNVISNMTISENEENIMSFFKTPTLFSLYLQIENYFDQRLFKNYFERGYLFDFIQAIDELLSYIPKKKGITVTNDGYLSQYSHFLAFFSSLDNSSKEEVKVKFPQLTKEYKEWTKSNRKDNQYIDLTFSCKEFVKSIYLEIQSLLVRKKIDYFSPSSRNEEIKKDNFASWIHKETILNDKYQSSINTAEVITARWIVNIIYEKMILLDFSVLEKYFMNYVLSYIHHPDYYEGKNERMFKS